MAHIAGKLGHVYGGALVLETCEAAWTAGSVASAMSTVAGKVGTNCTRATTTTCEATTLIQYKAISSTNITAYDGIYFWLRTSMATTAGQLQFLVDETNTCASPEESLNIPATGVATWHQCFARMTTPSALDAVLAVGLYQVANLDNGTFDVDDVEALAELDGIKSWSLDYTADTLEVTDFDDNGIKSYIAGGSGWSGSFEGFKEGVPLGIGSEVYLTFGESETAYQNWIGKVIITGAHPQTSHDGIVTYAYDFQGTGELQPPDA